jgi:hypothetical protein
MFWRRTNKELKATENDACQGCRRWSDQFEVRQCPPVRLLRDLAEMGLHLEVLHCPWERP